MLEIVSPFLSGACKDLWSWLMEFPSQNLDDSGPKSADELAIQVAGRQRNGEKIYLVVYGGRPVGAIGYMQVNRTEGLFRGICFTKSVHGSGIPAEAVKKVLNAAFDDGVGIVMGVVFSDNTPIQRFLMKLGGRVISNFLPSVKRGGKDVPLSVYGIRSNDFFRKMYKPSVYQGVPHHAGDVQASA